MFEPEYQNQNPAVRKIQDVKHATNAIMDRTATPASLWLLCTEYVVYLFNRMAVDSLDGLTPLEKAHGQQPDISALLHFLWFEPVLFRQDSTFPSQGNERPGRWVGAAQN